jgi:hypothetical protein
MDGWQASEAWRVNLRAEYILSEAGGRGRRHCGVGREEDSECQDRCPIGRCQNGRRVTPLLGDANNTIFISKIFSQKNLAKKLGRVLQTEISGMVCVRVGSAPPRPPFRADEKYPRGSFDRRLATSFMPPRRGLPLPTIDIAAEFTVFAVVPIYQPTSQTLGPRLGERASRASEVVIAGSAWHQEGHSHVSRSPFCGITNFSLQKFCPYLQHIHPGAG